MKSLATHLKARFELFDSCHEPAWNPILTTNSSKPCSIFEDYIQIEIKDQLGNHLALVEALGAKGKFMRIADLALLLLAFALTCVAPISALSVTTPAFEPVHEAELEKALVKYQNITQMDVRFKQKKILKDMDLALTSEGDLQLKMPDQVVYSINKPGRLVVTMNPAVIKFESGSGEAATTQTIKTGALTGDTDKRNLQAMMTWLKMDPVALAKNYAISTDHHNHFHFTPHDLKTSPFRELEIELGTTGHVKNLTMNEQSGDRIEFAFEIPKIIYSAKGK